MDYREALDSALKLQDGDAIFVCFRSMPLAPTPNGLIRTNMGGVFKGWHGDSISYWTESGALCVEPLDHVYISRPPQEDAEKIISSLKSSRGENMIVVPKSPLPPGVS